MVTKKVSRRAAATDFDGLIGTIERTKAPVEIEDDGRVVAVVLSPDTFEAWERRAFFAMLDEIREANAGQDADEVLADVTEAVEEVRQERYERQRV